MNKILNDRLNHLKSDLAELKNPKLDKIINEDKVYELEIRIEEVEFLLSKNG
jgi:hypothetical protein